MPSKAYDVVLIPEPRIAEAAIEVSGGLEQAGTHFTLDNKSFFPHISLYMLQLADDKKVTPLDEEDIAELAQFVDLLARFDFEDKQKEEKGRSK